LILEIILIKTKKNPVYDASSIIRTSDDNGITWKSKLYSGKDGQTANGRTNRLGGVAFIE